MNTTAINPPTTKRVLALAAAVVIACAMFCTAASSASAAFGIADFDGLVTRNAEGDPATQAGSHPYAVSTLIRFNTKEVNGVMLPDDNFKDVRTILPPGLVGNAAAIPQCPMADYAQPLLNPPQCDNSTVIGYARVETVGFSQGNVYVPLYNLAPGPDMAARFAFRLLTADVYLQARVPGSSDYAVEVLIPDTSQALPIFGTELVIWGVPADPRHDNERGPCMLFEEGPGTEKCPAGQVDLKPFLTMPTSCSGPTTTSLRVNSWQEPESWHEASFQSHDAVGDPVAIEGCEELDFEPGFEVEAERRADSPTALKVQIELGQDESPEGLATAHLKDATVSLPEGMVVNAAAANGLGACSPVQIGLDSDAPATCPASSKIASAQINSPALSEPLQGGVYLATQGTNPFGSTLAAYLVASGGGVQLKLPGRMDVDPVSGQITTSFENSPQLPFNRLTLDFFGGPNGILVTPKDCGTYTVTAKLTPWSVDRPVIRKSSFIVDSGPGGTPCAGAGFAPVFKAGTVNPTAGSFSPFVLQVTREDGMRTLSAIDAMLPPGVLAKLAGVPYCPDAALAAIPTAVGSGAGQAAAPSCPAASRVGTVSVGAGAGNNPAYVSGSAYLAGPYKGAPLSLAFVTPAVAGPLDLGNVVVRSALHVDPWTAQVRAISDPLPTILAGIPLNLRDVRVSLDRDRFTLNPTSCDPMGIGGQIAGAGGVVANVSQRFQAASCAALGFKPKLSLRLKGRTHRSGHPALTAVLKARKGDANIGRAVVTLPKTQFLEQDHIRTICTRVQYAEGNCPKASIYGYAKAWTPLLDQPLQGPVYLRSSSNELPDLVADLNGQIEIDLAGRIDSVKSRMRTTFWAVPDAPVSRFVLRMQGGKKGLLVNNTELCRAKPRAKAAFTGQNGKRSVSNPLVKVGCGKKNSKQQKRR